RKSDGMLLHGLVLAGSRRASLGDTTRDALKFPRPGFDAVSMPVVFEGPAGHRDPGMTGPVTSCWAATVCRAGENDRLPTSLFLSDQRAKNRPGSDALD